MQNFEYCCSTEIVFGKDTENKAGAKVKQYGGTKVALVYGGNSAKSSGLLDRIKDSLSAENIEVLELDNDLCIFIYNNAHFSGLLSYSSRLLLQDLQSALRHPP